MTEPQRHQLVTSSALTVAGCLILYLIVFGVQSFDPKSLILLIGFFAVAGKLATVKHKHNHTV